jgi:hypothetical protein
MQRPATVLCTSGLAVEAQIARAAGFSAVIRAGDRDRTAARVGAAAAQTECLISFGIAGGLAPELEAGTVIVSGEVVSDGCHWVVESQYMRRLSNFAQSIGAIRGPVLGATSILATRTEKKQAWATARRDLPPASLVPLSADGKPDLLGVLAAVLRRPFQVAGMIGLARETVIALSALIRPARALRSLVAAA